ncbi:MAG: phage tail sheath subtilisin-like domain-containing protein [Chloroflexota bacterium]|nr:phage tail sheath subtilisin-like domain-containing protein [Chloroflexota bacterium]
MPVTPTYPGVYIEEIPSGVRTITGVSTSVAAFVDYFKRGSMNKAVQIFSMGDFERGFGGLDELSEASYAIQQFFLNGGTEAWVVRVASADGSNPLAKATATLFDSASGGSQAMAISAASEGTWGNNLRVEVDYGTASSATQFNLTVSEVQTVSGRTVVTRQEVFRNLSMTSTDPSYVKTIVDDGSTLMRVDSTAGSNLPQASGSLSGSTFTFPANPPGAGLPLLVDVILDDGTSAVTKTANLGTTAIASVEEAAGRLQSGIRGADPGNPAWAQARAGVVAGVLQIVAGPSAPGTIFTFAAAAADANTVGNLALPTAAGTETNVALYQLGYNGSAIGAQGAGAATSVGGNGLPPDATALLGSPAVDPPTGLHALDKVDLFNILCLPRIARVSGTSTNFAEAQVDAVVSAATTYCNARRAFFVLDTPSNKTTVSQIKDWINTKATLRDKNVALYFPRVQIADSLQDFRLRSFGASGTIAGLYARTDANRGIWKAPAGVDAALRGVTRYDVKLNDAENGTLNPLGVNCLRIFDVFGNVCWGARTLDGADQQASEWKYVPVRRLALFLEESLFRGTQWVVFEPNDEPLWAQIRLNIGAFMHSLFRQGAFQGTTPRDAYFVKCDKETTTQDDINRGIVNIVVGFAPLKPAEFVIIKLQQIAGQIEV